MSYSNATYFLDYDLGSDTARAGFAGVASNPSGTTTLITAVGHGLVTGAVVVLSGFTAWLNSSWKITWVSADTFTLDDAVWAATADPNGTVTPNGGMSWTDAWKTITSGATAARIAPGDTIKIAKTPAPFGIGQAAWTDASNAVTIQALSSCSFTDSGATKVRVTKSGHNLYDGAVVTVSGTAGGTYDGTYSITVVTADTFDLNGTTYSADKSGTVTPAFTKVIDNSEVEWEEVVGADVTTSLQASLKRQGSYSNRYTVDAAGQANILQSYYATGTLDLSLYQKVTFWIYISASIAADVWKICLCSDVAGASPVDTIAIPALAKGVGWIPLTIARNGGGNLGNSIKSIALYSGGTAPTGGTYIQLDNISACTTDGFNLQNVFSKNSNEQGGDEPWLGLLYIDNNSLAIDQYLDDTTGFRGYSGTSNTANTYARKCIMVEIAAATTAFETVQDSGTAAGGNISFIGGHNTTTSVKEGETFFQSLNGNGYGLVCGKEYILLDRLNWIRWYIGLNFTTGANRFTIDNVENVNNCRTGISCVPDSMDWYIINRIGNCCCGDQVGLALKGGSYKSTITYIGSLCSNSFYGLRIAARGEIISEINRLTNNGGGNINISTDCGRWQIDFINYHQGSLFASTAGIEGTIKIGTIDGSFSGASPNDNQIIIKKLTGTGALSSGLQGDGYAAIDNYNNTGLLKAFFPYGDIAAAANDRVGGTGNKLTATITNVPYRNSIRYPIIHGLAKVAVEANKLVTVTFYAKRSHATNIQGGVLIPAGQLGLETDTFGLMTVEDTDWHQISFTALPTEKGVLAMSVYCYGQNASFDLADLIITQAA